VAGRPGLNDAVDGRRREAHSVSKEAYDLVKSKFREVRVGQTDNVVFTGREDSALATRQCQNRVSAVLSTCLPTRFLYLLTSEVFPQSTCRSSVHFRCHYSSAGAFHHIPQNQSRTSIRGPLWLSRRVLKLTANRHQENPESA
jgi:hypothetical protein